MLAKIFWIFNCVVVLYIYSIPLTSADRVYNSSEETTSDRVLVASGAKALTYDQTPENCTTQHEFPCKSGNCFTQELPPGADPDEPCSSAFHKVVVNEVFTKYSPYNLSQLQTIPINQWVVFQSADGVCHDIIIHSKETNTCILPGYCNSQFPWYINKFGELPKSFGMERPFTLCMTDTTSRNTAACCTREVNISVRSCGYYNIYKITQYLPKKLLGSLCTAPVKDILTGIEAKAGNFIKNGDTIPRRLDQLSSTAKENLVTTRFVIIRPSKFKMVDVIEKYNSELVEKLNNALKRRAKRWGLNGKLYTPENVKSVVGSPVLLENHLYHTFYIESDDGEVLNQSVIIKASKSLSNTELSPLYAYINSTVSGISSVVSYPQVSSKGQLKQPLLTEANKLRSDVDWMIIIYILCFTGAVIIITLFAMALYKWKFRKIWRANQSSSNVGMNDGVSVKISLKSQASKLKNGSHENGFIQIGTRSTNPSISRSSLKAIKSYNRVSIT